MTACLMLCAAALAGGWPTYHGDAGLRGVSDAALPDAPELLWRRIVGGRVSGPPVSDGARIYFAADRGRVAAIGLDGAALWETGLVRTNDAGQAMPVRFEAPPACGAGLVFAGSVRGTLHALDAATGAERWRHETGGTIVGSPNLLGSATVVVLDQSDGVLHALEARTGRLLWRTAGAERADGAPGVGGGRIVFGSCLAALHVYSTEGRHLADIDVGGDGQIAGGVAIEGGLAFAGTRDGRLLCADLERGEILWSTEAIGEQAFATPAVADALVVHASDDGRVRAVDKQTGKTVWTFDAGGLPTSPVVAGDKVAVSADGILRLLRLADGAEVWSREVADEATSPSLVGGLLVVGGDDGTVSAFGAREG